MPLIAFAWLNPFFFLPFSIKLISPTDYSAFLTNLLAFSSFCT